MLLNIQGSLQCTLSLATDRMAANAWWSMVNHNNDQDGYTLVYFPGLEYSDFVLLPKRLTYTVHSTMALKALTMI